MSVINAAAEFERDLLIERACAGHAVFPVWKRQKVLKLLAAGSSLFARRFSASLLKPFCSSKCILPYT